MDQKDNTRVKVLDLHMVDPSLILAVRMVLSTTRLIPEHRAKCTPPPKTEEIVQMEFFNLKYKSTYMSSSLTRFHYISLSATCYFYSVVTLIQILLELFI